MTQAPETCQSPDRTSIETRTNGAQAVNVALDTKAMGFAVDEFNDAYKTDIDGVVTNQEAAVSVAIRAYLSALLPADVKALLARLTKVEPEVGDEHTTRYYRNPDGPDVAAAITAQSALLDKAREEGKWHSPDGMPDTPKGTERDFIVAVRRARNGQIYSFPLAYLNAYPLRYEYECPKGDGCEGEGCEDGCPITGWYSATGDGDDGLTYSPMYMDPGDEFLGWREVPQWAASRLHHEMAEG